MTLTLTRAVAGALAALAATHVLADDTPFPVGPYTQDYATVWFTQDVSATTKLFQYAVINLGTAAYQDRTTDLGSGNFLYEWRRDTPMIKSYEVPILSAAALGSIDTSTITSPDGWSWRFVDATPDNWHNGSGDARFDNPYKLLQWTVDESGIADADLGQHMLATGIRPDWITRDWLIDAMTNPDSNADPQWGGNGCGVLLWHEGCSGLGFTFAARADKTLGPDQTGWALVTETGSSIITPAPRRPGDPDLPLKNDGLSFGGGVATIGNVVAVPEPSTYALMLGGLAAVGAFVRRRRQQA